MRLCDVVYCYPSHLWYVYLTCSLMKHRVERSASAIVICFVDVQTTFVKIGLIQSESTDHQ